MSENTKSGEDHPSDAVPVDGVWPPEIKHHFAGSPVILSKTQQDCVRYFWLHLLFMLMSAGIAAWEYFSAAHSLRHSPLHKIVFLCVCLLAFVGHLWRAVQGWQLKTVLKQREHDLQLPHGQH